MTDFEANLKRIQRRLGNAGFAKIREPYDTSRLSREVAVRDSRGDSKEGLLHRPVP